MFLKITRFTLLILFFNLFIACGASAETKPNTGGKAMPAWVNSLKKDPKIFYAVGYTEDVDALEVVKDKALANAKVKMAGMIFEQADVQKTFTTSGSLNSDEALKKTFDQQMRTKSAGRITGVEIDDFYYEEVDEGGLKVTRVWVLAKLPFTEIEKERARVLEEMKRKLEMVDKNIREAQAMIAKGQISDAIKAYLSAAISSTKVEERSDEFAVYVNQATKLLSGLVIDTSPNPKSIDTSLGTNLVFTVSYAGPSGKVPVSGAKVNFVLRAGSGDVSKSGITESDGTVKCVVTSLKEVRSDNKIDIKLALAVADLANLQGEAAKYYSTLRDSIEKVYNSYEFRSVSGANREITTLVVAMVDDGGFKEMKTLASKVKEALQSKGYKVATFDGSVSLEDLNEGKTATLKALAAKGYKQVAIVAVDSLPEPVYKDLIKAYSATWTYSFRLVDTETGEEKASKGGREAINTSTAAANTAGFVEKAGKTIKSALP